MHITTYGRPPPPFPNVIFVRKPEPINYLSMHPHKKILSMGVKIDHFQFPTSHSRPSSPLRPQNPTPMFFLLLTRGKHMYKMGPKRERKKQLRCIVL